MQPSGLLLVEALNDWSRLCYYYGTEILLQEMVNGQQQPRQRSTHVATGFSTDCQRRRDASPAPSLSSFNWESISQRQRGERQTTSRRKSNCSLPHSRGREIKAWNLICPVTWNECLLERASLLNVLSQTFPPPLLPELKHQDLESFSLIRLIKS